jgi:DNA invertase Pin-like site-specific DNA recombinase
VRRIGNGVQATLSVFEHVLAGLTRAKAQGKVLGRPKAAVRPERVVRLKERGLSIREIAVETGVSAMTVQRILAARARSSPMVSISRCDLQLRRDL